MKNWINTLIKNRKRFLLKKNEFLIKGKLITDRIPTIKDNRKKIVLLNIKKIFG